MSILQSSLLILCSFVIWTEIFLNLSYILVYENIMHGIPLNI